MTRELLAALAAPRPAASVPVGEGLAPPADPRSGTSAPVGEGLAPPAAPRSGSSASAGAGVPDGPLPVSHPGTSVPVGEGLAPPADPRSGTSAPVGEGLAPPAAPRSGTSVSVGAGVPNGPLPSAQPAASAPALPDLRAHLAALAAEAASIPGFDLAAALRDPDFVRLTAPGVGVGVRRAWDALHGDQLRRTAAEESARLLAQSVAQGLARPREGGGQTGAPPALDYRSLSRGEQLRLKERIVAAAARGEKLYP